MARRSQTPERIINKLREAEVLLSQGSTVGQTSRKIGVTDQTYFHWCREYGGMRIGEVIRSKEFEFASLFLERIGGTIPQSTTWRCCPVPRYKRWLPTVDDTMLEP